MSVRWSFDRHVFVDTGAHGALALTEDVNHRRAVEAAKMFAAQSWRLRTTNFVVAETHALILARAGRDAALRALHRIDRSSEVVIRVGEADELRARAIIERYRDKDFTLTDATSFAIMERLGIRRVFTFDRHFVQYGFDVIGLDR